MFNYFWSAEFILCLLVIFGGITSLFAGVVALFQYDLKKIIAYSTCSQLGYMFLSCGLSNYNLAFFIYEIMLFLKRYYF